MTPFELSLDRELDVEWQRFANDWLFKWHGMTYEGGVTDVDDFRGGRIHYGGIKFRHQQQQVFWQALERYLLMKVHETFQKWEVETKGYSPEVRLRSLDSVSQRVRQFVQQINGRAIDTDRRLRGKGYPASAQPFNSSVQMSRTEAEVVKLAEANKRLLVEEIERQKSKPKPLLLWEQLENFYSNNKGLIWLGGLLAAAALGIWRYLSASALPTISD
jgi:hypothetical protein